MQADPITRRIRTFSGRFGDKSREVERFIKFVIIGVICTFIDFGMLNLLQATILPPEGQYERLFVTTAAALAFCTGVISNFLFNRYWTYPDSRSRPVQLQIVQFFMVYIVALGIRVLVVAATYQIFSGFLQDFITDLSERNADRLGTNLAQMLSIGITMFWNFFANRYWTFQDVE